MRCFACNELVTHEQLDKPTGRYYCFECLESTTQVQLANIESDLNTRYGAEYWSDSPFGEDYYSEETEPEEGVDGEELEE